MFIYTSLYSHRVLLSVPQVVQARKAEAELAQVPPVLLAP